ncbi:MAG: hypothetical protein HUJ24_11195 [Rhodobacteraceae bacterium]|nr:hypothetical protein [Paracoccaceae bacterium]
MKKTMPFHRIARDPSRSLVHWIYTYDFRGRRHILAMTAMELKPGVPRLLIDHSLVRKEIECGALEETPLACEDIVRPSRHLTFLDELLDSPSVLGQSVRNFLEQNLLEVVGHVSRSAH